jgi:hypothetical protein
MKRLHSIFLMLFRVVVLIDAFARFPALRAHSSSAFSYSVFFL